MSIPSRRKGLPPQVRNALAAVAADLRQAEGWPSCRVDAALLLFDLVDHLDGRTADLYHVLGEPGVAYIRQALNERYLTVLAGPAEAGGPDA